MSETADLDDKLEKDKAAFARARMLLAAALGTAMPQEDAEDIFISHAHEFGVDSALAEATSNPAAFELASAPSQGMLSKIRAHVTEARDLADRMMEHVSERERILMAKDPARKPHYIWMGREFIIDPKMETITYVDTGETFAYLRDDVRPREDGPTKGKSR
ncbi:MAG: hypothetical protein JSR99_01270 [Proteobacteria bacterium]|nr:hypothetical protein [Pseudomonadota bacterium]